MKVNVERTEGVEHRITVELPAELVKEKFDEAAKELAKTVKIPGGYRKHKAKVNRIKQMYRRHILADLTGKLVQDTVDEALEGQELDTIGMPRMAEEPEVSLGKPFTYAFLVETRPTFDTLDYEKLVVPVYSTEVTDEDVDDAVEKLQQENSQLVDYEGDTIEDEAYITLNVKPDIDDEKGLELLSREGYLLKVNDDISDKLRKQLLGASLKEDLKLKGTPEEIYHHIHAEEFAEKELDWTAEVVKTQKFLKPEINDDFAKETRGLSSLLALRGELRENLQQQKKDEAHQIKQGHLTRQLIEKNKFDLPSFFVSSIAQDRMKSIVQSFEQYKGQVDDATINQLIQSQQQETLHRTVQDSATFFIMEALAEKLEIEVTDEEVEARIAEIAEERDVDVSFVKAELGEGTDGLKHEIKNDKIFKVLEEKGVERDYDEYTKELEEEAKKKAEEEEARKKAEEEEAGDEESPKEDADDAETRDDSEDVQEPSKDAE